MICSSVVDCVLASCCPDLNCCFSGGEVQFPRRAVFSMRAVNGLGTPGLRASSAHAPCEGASVTSTCSSALP
eukprot:1477947-Pleurochrysis_carterae.AAC.1